jgi:hypothetical protein
MSHPPRHCLGLAALTAASLFTTLPAQALGRLTDVQVIDRDSGETLTVHRHRGEHWVAGRPGARYAVSVRNATGERVMAVTSVDGVNVVSGETAAWSQTGYVLSPWQRYDITGWRKTDAEVAAFHFTALPDSYAARTGRPDHVGVIGVAVFREQPGPAVVMPPPEPYRQRLEAERLGQSATPPSPAPSGAAAESAASDSAVTSRRMAPATRLGTGHGEREHDAVGHTSFERRLRPDEIIRIRYDSRENLVAMGVIRALPVPPRPDPFPVPPEPRYAPDPH